MSTNPAAAEGSGRVIYSRRASITGTDVTKEAAVMTLTDDNFASIMAAVEEGRGIYGSIKQYLMYLLPANISDIGFMAGESLVGWPMPPTAVQIQYVKLATDGLPALALPVLEFGKWTERTSGAR